jgi:hypothetical protein
MRGRSERKGTRLRCKWCDGGNTRDDKGDHWIVQSVFPAKIKIVGCKLFKRQRDEAKGACPGDCDGDGSLA